MIFLDELKVNNVRNAKMSCTAFDESDGMPESDDNFDDSKFISENSSKKSKKPFIKRDNNDNNESENNDNNEFKKPSKTSEKLSKSWINLLMNLKLKTVF